ncbi:hypothetical protein H4R20_000038 [Coemansia guatemalensis]|uniref:Coiled-coil domain-containing protein 16 n=1 Tax=Coemansia guatemalensis TaxID=2761395 RepID=A0A9W8LXA5_9FUNG|nr:hypothetical protein H4R20_000038 [Coemansia guatemalensis]
MSKASARDLLRKAREQRKRQLRQGGGSNSGKSSLAALASNDSTIGISISGTLHCNTCKVEVKPADAVGWSAHSKSHRHQSNLQQVAATAAKRGHDGNAESNPADVSENLAAQLNIAQDTSDSVSKADEGAQQPADAKRRRVNELATYDNASDSDSSSNNSCNSSAEADGVSSDAGALPSGFFDEGVVRAEFSDEEEKQDTNCKTKDSLSNADNVRRSSISSSQHPTVLKDKVNSSAERALPNAYKGHLNNGNGRMMGTSDARSAQETAEHTKNLKDSLAAFESEISNLANPDSEQQQDSDDTKLSDKPSDYAHSQEERWNQRARHLAQLNTIIQEGMQGMNPGETLDTAADDDTSEGTSSDAEYAGFTDWRSCQL